MDRDKDSENPYQQEEPSKNEKKERTTHNLLSLHSFHHIKPKENLLP